MMIENKISLTFFDLLHDGLLDKYVFYVPIRRYLLNTLTDLILFPVSFSNVKNKPPDMQSKKGLKTEWNSLFIR